MHRLKKIRQIVDEICRQQPEIVEGRCGFVHLYGVSAAAALLALRRGLDTGRLQHYLYEPAQFADAKIEPRIQRALKELNCG
jgi:hypothetical protein